MTNPRTHATNEADTSNDRDFATLTPEGERWCVHFVRTLRHPPEKVWRAITEPDHLPAWFPTTIDGERRAGAALRFAFKDFQQTRSTAACWSSIRRTGWNCCGARTCCESP